MGETEKEYVFDRYKFVQGYREKFGEDPTDEVINFFEASMLLATYAFECGQKGCSFDEVLHWIVR